MGMESRVSLRELLRADFGIDFPISGDSGQSRESPIVIHRQEPDDYVAVEYGVLRCLGHGRGVRWRLIQQAVFVHNGRRIDQLKIETVRTTREQIVKQIENYYFDITESFPISPDQ